uniref:DUF7788 domain-containing protein n=1 Tax=Chenopodium quinoa TaxID=63459 RepID=A0A803KSW0_CHEQI
MLRRLFVFIDEDFEKVSAHPWETEYAGIKAKFLDRGFEKVPEVVFWNLKGLIGGSCVLTPESVMDATISSPEYDQLIVHGSF